MLSENEIQALMNECHYSTSRSSGPGGQNVNKVNTKVELRFHIDDSNALSDEQKDKLKTKLANKINLAGELVLVSQDNRSQLKNKESVSKKFLKLVEYAMRDKKKRKTSKPTAASIEKRLEKKKRLSDIKKLRKKID